MGDHDSFLTDTSENDLDQGKFTQSETITDSQFDDHDMLYLIKSSFGQLDRKTFKQELTNLTDVEDLKPIRNSLFDLIRKQEKTYSESKLVERTQRENGQSLGEKLADDIFIIYQYLEGANNVTELRQCISRSKQKTVTSDENDTSIADIFLKLSQKTPNTKTTENTFVVSMLLELKSMINDTVKPIADSVEKFTEHFENQIKELRKQIKEKDNLILSLKEKDCDSQIKIAKLQAECKLHSQTIKDQNDNFEQQIHLHDYREKIASRLDSIDNRIKNQKEDWKKSYSDALLRKNDDEDTCTSQGGKDRWTRPKTADVSNASAHDTHKTKKDNRESYNLTEAPEQDYYPYTNEHDQDTGKLEDTRLDDRDHHNTYSSYNSENNRYRYERNREARDVQEDPNIFRGAHRRRTKRIVLYNVSADESFEQVDRAVRSFVEEKGAHVTFTKMLKRSENRGRPSYIMRVNINENDYFSKVENDSHFWPEGIYVRDYVPHDNSQRG